MVGSRLLDRHAAIDVLVCRPVPEAAVGLLDLAGATLAERWPQYPASRAAAVRAMLTNTPAD